MEFSSTVEFANAARLLSRAVAHQHLCPPSFRCPPRLVGVDRTIRRRNAASTDSSDVANASVVVSIRVKGRRREAVVADMIEGVIVTNALLPPEADRIRNELWEAMSTSVESARGAA